MCFVYRFASSNTSIPICLYLTNESGYYLDMSMYREVTDQNTGQVCVHLLSSSWCKNTVERMSVRSPKNFSPPNPFAQNAVRQGSVRPPVLFVQGPFARIFMLWPTLGNQFQTIKPVSWRKLFSNHKPTLKLVF